MRIPRCFAGIAGGIIIVFTEALASGQGYPNKPIRIVSSETGSTNDFGARLIAQGLTASLSQQVIVDNRALSAVELVAGAQPDGYTLLSYGTALWLAQFLRDNVSWDAARDFAPISWTTNSPNILVVHPSLPANSVKELIALAKARPGELNYASGSTGSASHLGAELFKSLARVNIVRIPFKGTSSAMNSVVGGEVQLMVATAAAVAPHVKSQRLRALAVTSARPSALAPGLPTVAASGLPGYEWSLVLGLFAPGKTPSPLVKRLNEEVVRVLNRRDVKERFFSVGTEAVGSTAEEFSAKIKAEIAIWGKVIKEAGIREE